MRVWNRICLDKSVASGNNHADDKCNDGFHSRYSKKSDVVDLSADLVAVGRALCVDPGFHISDAQELV